MANTFIKNSYIQGETIRIRVNIAGVVAIYADIAGNRHDFSQVEDSVWECVLSTATLTGFQAYTIFATNVDNDIYAIDNGRFFVKCSSCSNLREVLKKIDEAIATWGTNPNRSISVGEINITYKTLDELLAVRAQMVQRINEAETGTSGGGFRTIQVRF